ncbi:MAG: hypothetical protein MRERV_16c013 [Mycoplasmataceae bacterium RV_VA103A]|nr:MAG: hypothetical protein MRERV_16c013 [Mycoplasmataceae bacterium RV_VA103A]
MNGINQKTFNELVKAGLDEETIKQKIGDLNTPWKGDIANLKLKPSQEQKLDLYDKLQVSDLPFDWKLRLERLKELDKNQDQYLQNKEELQGWTDTFEKQTPQAVKERISELEEKLKQMEQEKGDKIKELETKLEEANNKYQQTAADKDKEIRELGTKLNNWMSIFSVKELDQAKQEYENLSKRPDLPITSQKFWDDYVYRWTKERSDKMEKDLQDSQGKAAQYWQEKQRLRRHIEKFLADQLLKEYVSARPVIRKDQAEKAIEDLLNRVYHNWTDYLEKNITTPQNLSFALNLADDEQKKIKARQVLDWVGEALNKQLDYQQLFEKWSGSKDYRKENDFDGGSLYFLASNLGKYLQIENFGTPKLLTEEETL